MIYRFNPRQGLVMVQTTIEGPSGNAILHLALDTGATDSPVNAAPLIALGYDPALSPDRIQVTTGSSVEFAPHISLLSIEAPEQEHTDFPVLCHTLPPSAGIDGLPGPDFLRGLYLMIDFHEGTIRLS